MLQYNLGTLIMSIKGLLAVCIMLAFLFCEEAHSQSFNCGKANNRIEVMICSDKALSKLDEEMGSAYFDIRNSVINPSTKEKILGEQREWLGDREKCLNYDSGIHSESECLEKMYTQRISLLKSFRNISSQDTNLEVKKAESEAIDDLPTQAPYKPSTEKESYADLFEKLQKHVVVVLASQTFDHFLEDKTLSQGSGVIIGKKLVATNCHVLKGKEAFMVIHGGEVYPAKIYSGRFHSDACLIDLLDGQFNDYVSGSQRKHFSELKVGEEIIAIGSPSGLENTLSVGIISGLRTISKDSSLIQITAAISPGSSGGGLFDIYGNLVGITTSTLRDTQSINFAIPIENFSGL